MSSLLKCVICSDTGWGSPYSTPRKNVLVAVFVPCSHHGAMNDVPDCIEIPASERRTPTRGVDFVVVRGSCSCGAATRNGVCTDLACEHAPKQLNCGARVWVIGDPVLDADGGVYAVCEDYGDGTMTLITYDSRPGRMLIRIPRTGWGTLGFPPFPANDPRSADWKGSAPTNERPDRGTAEIPIEAAAHPS